MFTRIYILYIYIYIYIAILEFTAEELNELVVPCNSEPSMLAVCVCSFVIIVILCLITCLLPLAAADSFVDLFTVSQWQL